MEYADKRIKGRKITGLPVIAREDGSTLGYVRELLYDPSGLEVSAILLEEGNWIKGAKLIVWEELGELNRQTISVSGPEVVMDSHGDEAMSELCKNRLGPCGYQLCSSSGEELGKVGDVILETSSGRVVGLELTQGLTEDLLEGRKELELNGGVNLEEGKLIIME